MPTTNLVQRIRVPKRIKRFWQCLRHRRRQSHNANYKSSTTDTRSETDKKVLALSTASSAKS